MLRGPVIFRGPGWVRLGLLTLNDERQMGARLSKALLDDADKHKNVIAAFCYLIHSSKVVKNSLRSKNKVATSF